MCYYWICVICHLHYHRRYEYHGIKNCLCHKITTHVFRSVCHYCEIFAPATLATGANLHIETVRLREVD